MRYGVAVQTSVFQRGHKMKNLFAIFSLVAICATVHAGSRTFVETNEVTDAYYKKQPLKGWQAESIDYTIYAERNGEPVTADAGYYPMWFLFSKSNATQVYWAVTGIVESAENGVYSFAVTPSECNVPATRYRSMVRLYSAANEYIETLSARY